MLLHSHHLLSSLPSTSSARHRSPLPLLRFAPSAPTAARAAGLRPLLAQAPEDGDARGGPIELPSAAPSPLFAVDDNPTPLQTATSVLLTGAISVFLFRSLRRRAKRVKELRVRSKGVKPAKDLKAEALESLRALGAAAPEARGPPSPIQALLGGVAAGVIALILYKFTATIEAALNRQAISDNYSVRQITITIRTIINGMCYLATFVFGVNSIGLVLYSIQLTFDSIMETFGDKTTSDKKDEPLNSVSSAQSSADNLEARSDKMQGGSDDG